MAPAYANIFMGQLEGQLLRSVSLKPFSWFRCIDGVDIKWTHGHENLEIFLQEANSFYPTIRLTAEISNEGRVFLDTKSRLVGNDTDVDLYTKTTDTQQYILNCSRNVPYSLALRLWRICSNLDTFESRARLKNKQLPQRHRKLNRKEEKTCFATSES